MTSIAGLKHIANDGDICIIVQDDAIIPALNLHPHSRLNVLRIRDRPRLLCLFFITVSRLGRGLLRFRLNVVEPIFVITRVCGVKISCSDCETSQAFNYIISTLICHFIAFILDSLLHSICLLGFIFIVMRLFSFPQEIGWNSPTWVL